MRGERTSSSITSNLTSNESLKKQLTLTLYTKVPCIQASNNPAKHFCYTLEPQNYKTMTLNETLKNLFKTSLELHNIYLWVWTF